MTTHQQIPHSLTPAPTSPALDRPRWVGHALVLAIGAFAMGTDSFVLAGILPQLAQGLHATGSAAGQAVTAFALTYALAAPILAACTSRFARKPLLTVALTLFAAANLASAASPSLGVLLAARVLAGISAALFTPNASAAAVALAGPASRGRALSIVLGGLTVGTVLGVPIGTAIGQHLSWRASLVFVAAVSALALLSLLAKLPKLPPIAAVPLAQRLALLVRGHVLAIVTTIFLATAGSIMVYTYIAQILEHTAHVRGATLAVALLMWGIGGTAGAFGSGWLTDRHGATRTLSYAIAALAVTLIALPHATSAPVVYAVMLVNGAAGWAMATPNNHRLTALAPAMPSVVISYNSSGIYLGQAAGAALGGLLLTHQASAAALCLTGAALAGAALVLNLAIAKTAPRRSTQSRLSR